MKNQKNIISLFLLLLLSFLVLLLSIYIENLNNEINLLYFKATLSQIKIKKIPQEIVLMFVGDVMLDRGVKWSVDKHGSGDWRFPFLKIVDTLREADVLFGNLEGPISDKGVKVGSIYSFRADPEVIEGLKFAGFDILSVANNHIFDYGRKAMEDNFKRLKEAGINYVGGGFNENEAYSPIIKEVSPSIKASSKPQPNSSGQVKIAFLAYTNLGTPYWSAKDERSGIAWLTEENLVEGVKKVKDGNDLVIVFMHFGEEYKIQPSLEQKYFARLAIDSGADLVVGHHPHVIQPVEKYNEGYIAYSLGNFVFDQSFSEETMKGLLLKVLVKDGRIKELIPVEVKINEFFQSEIAAKK